MRPTEANTPDYKTYWLHAQAQLRTLIELATSHRQPLRFWFHLTTWSTDDLYTVIKDRIQYREHIVVQLHATLRHANSTNQLVAIGETSARFLALVSAPSRHSQFYTAQMRARGIQQVVSLIEKACSACTPWLAEMIALRTIDRLKSLRCRQNRIKRNLRRIVHVWSQRAQIGSDNKLKQQLIARVQAVWRGSKAPDHQDKKAKHYAKG